MEVGFKSPPEVNTSAKGTYWQDLVNTVVNDLSNRDYLSHSTQNLPKVIS